ncbi:hypothetical protein ADL26_15180, partial [Thermoactinomyces vulgaris]
SERREELQSQLQEAQIELSELENELAVLNERRAGALEFLRDSESVAKYKTLSRDLTSIEADVKVLEARREAASRMIDLRQEKRTVIEDLGHAQTSVEQEVERIGRDDEGRFVRTRTYFNEIISKVLGQN